MCKAVEQGRRQLGIAKHRGPFAEAEVGGDDDAGAFVELAEQVEEQGPARGAERQVSQLVEDHQVEAGKAFGDLPGLALGLFLFQRIYQLDGREEASLSAVMFDGLNAEGGCDVGLSGSWPPDQHDVLRPVDDRASESPSVRDRWRGPRCKVLTVASLTSLAAKSKPARSL